MTKTQLRLISDFSNITAMLKCTAMHKLKTGFAQKNKETCAKFTFLIDLSYVSEITDLDQLTDIFYLPKFQTKLIICAASILALYPR